MKQNFLSAALTFDLWQEPIGNGRRYCKIQYNDTGTGSYPLPVEVPSPVLPSLRVVVAVDLSWPSNKRLHGGGGGGGGGGT